MSQENQNIFAAEKPFQSVFEDQAIKTQNLKKRIILITDSETQFLRQHDEEGKPLSGDREDLQIQIMHVDKLILRRKKLNRFKKYWQKLQERCKQISLDDTKMQQIISIAETIPKKPIVPPFVLQDENIIKYCKSQKVDNQNEQNLKIQQDQDLQDNIVEQDPMKQIAEIRQMIQAQDFQKLLYIAQQDLKTLSSKNQQELKELYESVKQKFVKAEQCPVNAPEYRDTQIYKPEEIWRYGQDFIGYVDPAFIQDMVQNKDWYAEHSNQFLLNINYPCKLQTDFLKELELAQQRRNDLRYRKILENMDQIDHIKCQGKDLEQDNSQYIMNSQSIVQISDEQRRKELEASIRQMSLKQRTLIAQDDACCAICGVGDYEDDNQIVFCVQCSIPVHQQCFGLEAIPEIDWICYNCITFGFQRGLMVKCLLCPKRGGAMKPTNIFRSYEKYYEQKIKNLSKKTSKTNLGKLNVLTKENQNIILTKQQSIQWAQVESIDLEDALPSETQGALEVFNSRVSKECQKFKSEVLQRLENNCCLSELIQREVNYKEKVQQEYHLKINEWESNGSKPVDLNFNESEQIFKRQDEFELSFTKHELSNHCIPEDYSHFVQRNESKLEADDAPQSDSLYHWVHHSCSMWTQGPQVTPKTPVRMNRLDFQKFGIGCVICGQKGPNVGAAVKCYKTECQIYFHVECAKRANYCMEIDKKSYTNNNLSYAVKVCQRDKLFKIYCESHRPFKIIQEINEQNIAIIEDIQKFTKTIQKCLEISQKQQIKPKKLISKSDRNKMLRQALILRKHELVAERKEAKLKAKPKKEKQLEQRQKKWKEKDKKLLLERVKEKYLQIRKMRFNIFRINPIFQESSMQDRELKRIQKFNEKKKKKLLQNQQKQFFEDMIVQEHNKITEQVQIQRINEIQTLDDIFEGGDCSIKNLDQNIDMDDSSNEEDKHQEELSNQLDQQESTQSTFYKFSSPVQELEWTVTLSRYDFPWREIAFEQYTARDCYKKYTEIVQDVHSFLTRVLGNKMKYQRMIQNQLMGQPTIDTLMNMQNIFQLQTLQKIKQEDVGYHMQSKNTNNNFYNGVPQTNQDIFEVTSGRRKILKGKRGKKVGSYNFENQIMIDIDNTPLDSNQQLGNNGSYLGMFNQGMYQIGQQNHAPQYCKCRGLVPSSFMVACETGEDKCINGGWLHPQCTDDLNLMTEEQINQIDIWFCQDCKALKNLPKSGQDRRDSSSEWNSLSSPTLFKNKTTRSYNKGEQSSNQETKDQLQADEDLIFPNNRTNLSSNNIFQPQFQNLNKIVFQIDRSPQKHKSQNKNEKILKQGRQRLEKNDFLKEKVLEKKKQNVQPRKSSQILNLDLIQDKEIQNIIELNPLESSENKSQKSLAQINSQIQIYEEKHNICSQLPKPEVDNTWASSVLQSQAKEFSQDNQVPDLIGQYIAMPNLNSVNQLHNTPALANFLRQNSIQNNQQNSQDAGRQERLLLQQLEQLLSNQTEQNFINIPEFQQVKTQIEDKSSLRQQTHLEFANLMNQLQCIANNTPQDNRFRQLNPQIRFQQDKIRYGQQNDIFSQVQNLVQERVPAIQEILRAQQQNEQVQFLQFLQMQLHESEQQNGQQGQIVQNNQDSYVAQLFQMFLKLQEVIKMGAQVNSNELRQVSQASSQAGGHQIPQSQPNRGGQSIFSKQMNQQILQERDFELTDEQIEMILSQISQKYESQK